ncbi:MAG: hypothetical protein ABIP08_01475 [Lautropia sp.]
MATNLSIDPELLNRALEVSGERTNGIARRHESRAIPQVTLLAETSAWSLAMRRNEISDVPQVRALQILRPAGARKHRRRLARAALIHHD